MRSYFFLVLFVLCGFTTVFGQTMNVICDPPKGYGFFLKDGKIGGSEDSIQGTHTVYTWNTKTESATIVTQNAIAAGGEPFSYTAAIAEASPSKISFIFRTANGIELHTLFLSSSLMFSSMHNDMGQYSKGAATAKTFYSKCKIGLQ